LYASPATHVGYELIGAWMLILAGDGRGLPIDYDELEPWTRVGYERGMRSRKGERQSCCIVVSCPSTTGPASASVRLDIETPDTRPSVFHITSGSDRVVYPVTDTDGPSPAKPAQAFSVPIAGPANVRAQVNLPSEFGDFVQVSPDGSRVVWKWQIFSERRVSSAAR
jgi:hypothetical protein